jgi:hypothetical protein
MLDAHLNNRLSNHPPFGGFDATIAASSRLTALIEVFGVVGTARVFALIEARPMLAEPQASIRVTLATTTSLISNMCLLR